MVPPQADIPDKRNDWVKSSSKVKDSSIGKSSFQSLREKCSQNKVRLLILELFTNSFFSHFFS